MRIEKVGGATSVCISPSTDAKELISDCETVIVSAPLKVRPTESGLSISEFRGEVLKACNEDRTS
jgi:hypothetical protein